MAPQDGIDTYAIEWEKHGEEIGFTVVDGDGATLLFGAGVDGMVDDLSRIVEGHGVDVVVVEHGDRDHYEGAPALRDRHGVEIAVPAGDAVFLREAGIDPDHLIDTGIERWGVETISVPGHTRDNAAYLVGDLLVAGDTVVGVDSVFSADGDWSGPLAVITAPYNEDERAMRESVGRLLEYDFERVNVSHGSDVRAGGKRAVATLVEDLGVGR